MIDTHPLPDDDVIVHSGPAERADVTGLPNLFGAGSRYRWRFIAYGVAVTYRTDAAGLQLYGRVVSRPVPFGDPIMLVQLADHVGRVVASVPAMPDETALRQLATRLWNHLAGEAHMPSQTGGCWCAPAAGLGRHVNEDGSPC